MRNIKFQVTLGTVKSINVNVMFLLLLAIIACKSTHCVSVLCCIRTAYLFVLHLQIKIPPCWQTACILSHSGSTSVMFVFLH